MGKSVHNDVLDAAHSYVQTHCTRVTVCSAEPTTYTEANATYALADVTVDSGDFTIADGDTSGRKITLGAQAGVLIDTSGTATHIALLDVANTKLLRVTTTTSLVLVANGSNTVDIPATDFELRDPQ